MEERTLYPLKFIPIFKSKVWGGNAIKEVLGLDYGRMPNCGEAWMLSGLDGEESVVANGFLEGNTLVELVEVY
ncbi:MAG: mannose-6-phosphate isomerase, partial [Bacteroidales bacterium]|nr:mannose-6-phosphate isomerase [Bacteroidales bacterium]